jgi:hypothetical protein
VVGWTCWTTGSHCVALRIENEADLRTEDEECVSGGGDSVCVCLAVVLRRKVRKVTGRRVRIIT